jgi:hypothetical protein
LPSQNPAASNGGVLYRLPSHHTIFRWNVLVLMIGRMIAPSARMMLSYPAAVQKILFWTIADLLWPSTLGIQKNGLLPSPPSANSRAFFRSQFKQENLKIYISLTFNHLAVISVSQPRAAARRFRLPCKTR